MVVVSMSDASSVYKDEEKRDMKIHRIDHVGIIVNDLSAATAFFLELGLEVLGKGELEGELLNTVTGLNDAKTELVMLGAPDGQTELELVKYHRASDENGIPPNAANTLGIRHIAFAVEDIDAIVAKLKKNGTEFFSEIQNYEGIYKLCYVHGPEGIILELAEKIN